MKKSTKIKSLVAAAAVACFGFAGLIAAPTHAVGVDDNYCKQKFGNEYVAKGGTCVIEDDGAGLWSTVQTVINVVLAVVGVIAVFMIIIGGIQYSTSAGDSGKVKKAKDTILYGIIGLVIALLAFAIVNFVLDSIFSAQSTGNSSTNNTPVPTPSN